MCMVGLWAVFGLRHIERLLFGWLAIKWLWWMVPDLPERIVMVLLLRYVGFFAVGMVAYRVWAGHRTWRQQAPLLTFVLATLLLTEGVDRFLVGCILMACFYALLRGWLAFLCVRPLVGLGRISYPLYLIHQHIGFVIMFRSEEHTSELQSLMRISYAVFCLKKKQQTQI